MNDDNIEFQPGGVPTVSDTKQTDMPPAKDSDSELGAPKIFDFSSDMNISVVKDDAKPTSQPQKPIAQPIVKPIFQQPRPVVQPQAPKPAPQPRPTPPPPINRLTEVAPEDLPGATTSAVKEWPFASPQTIANKAAAESSAPDFTSSSSPLETTLPTMPPLPTSPMAKATPPPIPNPIRRAPPIPQAVPQKNSVLPATKPSAPSVLQEQDPTIKNLRTYEGDIAQVLAQRGTSKPSMASVAIAESQKKGEGATIRNLQPAAEEKAPVRTGSKLIIMLISIILICIGILAGYYLYSRSPLVTSKTPPVVSNRSLPSLIPSDSQATVTTDDQTVPAIQAMIVAEAARPLAAGRIKEIVMLEKKDGQDYRVSAAEMAALMDVPVPDIIARTLQPQWMFGVYADQGVNRTFIVVNTNLFQNAFAGMLAWEPTLPNDLKSYISPQDAATAQFKDEIVRNKDVRAFVTHTGRTMFLYSFIDNNTLVIAENETTLNAIVARLENKAFVR